MSDDKYYLNTPFFGILGNLGFSHYGDYHYFQTGNLFWSLTRLFLYYHRILELKLTYKKVKRGYLESDIENYIIRHKIVLNDVAYILWQLLHQRSRGLKKPTGGTHPVNREMRFKDIIDYVNKNEKSYPLLKSIMNENIKWINKLSNERDNILHYKSQVVVFETKPQLSFAILDAANTRRTIPTNGGVQKVIMTPVFDFINSQTVSLWNFLNEDLVKWIKEYIKSEKLKYKEFGEASSISCKGVYIFKEINNIV